MTAAQRQHRLAVFFRWDWSTVLGINYLGISIAVENIPPALMCATRFLVAGAYAGLLRRTGRSIR